MKRTQISFCGRRSMSFWSWKVPNLEQLIDSYLFLRPILDENVQSEVMISQAMFILTTIISDANIPISEFNQWIQSPKRPAPSTLTNFIGECALQRYRYCFLAANVQAIFNQYLLRSLSQGTCNYPIYSCHGVFTDRSFFSLNWSWIQIPA